jgi:hypothetical protein
MHANQGANTNTPHRKLTDRGSYYAGDRRIDEPASGRWRETERAAPPAADGRHKGIGGHKPQGPKCPSPGCEAP